MNIKNMVLTYTGEMNREQWLAFRKPINHATKFLSDWYAKQSDPAGFPVGFLKSEEAYEFLVYVFDQPQWKEFIFPCVGASEISACIGLNPYKSVIELYYEKVGIKETWDETNEAMFWGKELEAQVAEKWQYWDGNVDSYLRNYEIKNMVRKCRRINAYVQNKNFPWIFASLDRIINKHGGKSEGSLECKTISGFAANKWEAGIPPDYVCQNQTQIAVCEFDHGEIAVLKDGRNFDVLPFDRNDNVIARLKSESYRFFLQVKKGLEQYLLYKAAPSHLKDQHLAFVDSFSPEPDGSISYETYLKGAYNEQGYEVPGGIEQLHLARAYKYYDGKVKELEAMQRECSNRLKAFMKDAARLDFGLDGHCTWKANTKGVRTFNVKVQAEDYIPEPELLKTIPLETEQ